MSSQREVCLLKQSRILCYFSIHGLFIFKKAKIQTVAMSLLCEDSHISLLLNGLCDHSFIALSLKCVAIVSMQRVGF